MIIRTNPGAWLLAATLGLGLAACGGEVAILDEDNDELLEDGKYEAWNTANNPAYVDSTFVYEVDKLPLTGRTKTPPIPGDYWAIYKDNINVRWEGESSLSPSEKFEKALGKTGVVKAVSENHGIKSHNRKTCTKDADCADLKDGSKCAIPRGETGGRCIPTWWGICHGWAPYAISEAPPTRPVVRNGVTFYPGDLEGLMSLAYSKDLPTKFISQRCNKREPGYDNTGRVRDAECRDMNPGTWHIVATNFLGLRQTGFVEDRTAFDEVWNQPTRGYQITNGVNGKLKEITKDEAIKLLGLDLRFTEILAATPLKKAETKAGTWTATVTGEVVFKSSGTGDADLFMSVAPTVSESTARCRSTGNTSAEECRLVVKPGDVVSWLLKGYGETNTAALSVGVRDGVPNYSPNTAAKRFFFVQMDFQYISESPPARTSHIDVIDQFTRTDHYEYILETDDAGRVQGGEWVGESRTEHPDFAWWPTAKPRSSLAAGLITYDEVKAIHDESSGVAQGGTVIPTAEEKVLLKDVTLTTSSQYPTIGVPGGATLTVKMTGTGNADLYLRLGAKPTVSSFGCRSMNPGSIETCTIKAPQSGGTYYVRARPVTSPSTVTVTATIIK